jgi:hypothetical protein
MYFDVRVIAFDPNSTEDPVESLVRVFRVERTIARELVNRLPRVIKRGVPLETAQKFCDVLERLGARTEIVMSAPKEPEPASPPPPLREPPRNVGSGRGMPAVQGRSGPAMPAPGAAALTPVVSHVPANANGAFARAPERASAARNQGQAAVFGNHDSSVFFLPEPQTSDTMRLPPRGSAPRPSPRAAPLDDVRARHGLPAPREPDPLEADINSLVDRALAEAPSAPPAARPGRPSRRPTLAQEPEEVRVTYNPLPNLAAEEARNSAPAPEPFRRSPAEPAPEPYRRAPAEPAPAAPRHKRDFRPARPVPEFEEAAPAVREALLPQQEQPPFRDRPPAPPAAPEPAPPPRESVALPATGTPFSLPALLTAGPQADRSQAVLRGSRSLLRNVKLISGLLFGALSLVTLGLAAVAALAMVLWDAQRRRLCVRAMQGSAVPVGQAQLPELYGWVKQLGMRLDLPRTPRLYLGRRARADLLAVPFRGEMHVLLDGEAFARHVREGNVHVMTFLLAHELSRHVLGHTGRVRTLLASLWPALGRIDALSADALATQLVGDRQLAQRALLTLLAGSSMAELLDFAELERQGASHERNSAVRAPALDAGSGFLLTRLYHMQHGYQRASARASAQEP